ncbi:MULTISPECIES: hypothetical protein [unclassified Lentimonas]|uniref:hypothetical protein n=1 Tax=unclassified Lentimonas TaxID=2630993 RepID=UPI0013295759|nr:MULTISPECIES: hypothetical protein [unclassified Lentimonas]CAA6679495.1 Unannotated [Lentimonas sp. CC4]CAA6687166.1 Unannotated [Lentimonas sp. CC6]CAA7075487.1 Unannotated [Lentimonas sp. CC4]CAA7170254.1 Unannotated [Lentimonas sp. CC21]CAA7182548.1 Unannotated [Lentimonas sp. CC8]
MSLDLFLNKVLPYVFTLSLYISLGVLIGVLLEITGAIKGLAKIARPILALGNFPAVCAAAFVTAFSSAKTAHSMLASAYRGQQINRRELILGAVANSLPVTLMHLKFFAPMMISVLGGVGAAYVGFIVGGAVLVFLAAVLLSRILVQPRNEEAVDVAETKSEKIHKRFLKMLWQRWSHMTLRVLAVAIPVYTAVAWIKAEGGFKWLAGHLPASFEAVFPVESMTIIIAQLSGTTAAVSSAKSLLENGGITEVQLFFTLVAGYSLALPIKVLRRNLPSALSIFPESTGFWIIGATQGLRLALALSFVTTYIFIIA